MIDGFESGYAEVNKTTLHYVAGGTGEPLILLPGWPMTWREWRKVMPALAEHRRVVAVDLRGMGESAKPETGYDKKTIARDIYELIRHLGFTKADVAGNDIGSMVTFSLAANHPDAVRRIAMFEVPHPDNFFHQLPVLPQPGLPHLWWFGFNQIDHLPEDLLRGRFRLLIDWLIDRQAAYPAAIDEQTRVAYAEAYEQPGAITAANRWFQAFGKDIEDIQTYERLTVPVLAVGGLYMEALRAAVSARAEDVSLAPIPGGGHYLAEEQPDAVVKALEEFFS